MQPKSLIRSNIILLTFVHPSFYFYFCLGMWRQEPTSDVSFSLCLRTDLWDRHGGHNVTSLATWQAPGILLSLPHWSQLRCARPGFLLQCWESELRSSHLHSKDFTDSATSPSPTTLNLHNPSLTVKVNLKLICT